MDCKQYCPYFLLPIPIIHWKRKAAQRTITYYAVVQIVQMNIFSFLMKIIVSVFVGLHQEELDTRELILTDALFSLENYFVLLLLLLFFEHLLLTFYYHGLFLQSHPISALHVVYFRRIGWSFSSSTPIR